MTMLTSSLTLNNQTNKGKERIFQEVRKQIRLPTEDTPVIMTAFFYNPVDYRSRVSLCNWVFSGDQPSVVQGYNNY